MIFSSLIFIFIFLPITILIYYISPKRWKNLVLLIGSLIFYSWGEPVYIFLMIFSTIFNYFSGILIDYYREKLINKRIILTISLFVNLGILGFFKYSHFIVENINILFNSNMSLEKLSLPLGISFYTFQTLSYIIDIYRDKVPVQRDIISFGTYITMFPQLVAGPIVKYEDIYKDLEERNTDLKLFGEGVELFIIGLSKKVLLSNNIGILWDTIKSTSMDELSILSAWLGILAFTFQIYLDFSGYSNMARGLGKMFGFNLMENFDYPYISTSVTEFWRRWHISLGNWFREYVYIPLGGNRVSNLKNYRNLIIVWFLTGLWHGASWNFILWGLYYGFFIILEKRFLLKALEKINISFRRVYTFLIVVIGWVFFEFESLMEISEYIKSLFFLNGLKLTDGDGIYYLYTNLILFIIIILVTTPIIENFFEIWKNKLGKWRSVILPMIYLILMILNTAYLVNETYNPFLYFRF